jgi:hypothetical protein
LKNSRRIDIRGWLIVFLLVTLVPSLPAQTSAASALAGKVSNASGGALSNVTVTATSADTGQAHSTVTGTDGTYKFELLSPGNYRVKFEAAGFKTVEIASATVNGTETVVLDGRLEATAMETQEPALSLSKGASTTQHDSQANHAAPLGMTGGKNERSDGKSTAPQQDNLPNAPSSSSKEPSLEDLGFPAAQTQGDAKQQALLDKRTHMLKIHQRMGLITTIPVVAAIFSSAGAGGKSASSTGRDVHLALGAVAGDLYGITAYYAIRAPRIKGTETRGPIRVHKALAWVHGPGMILTPILGAIAYDQKSKGERVHGIASAHMPVAIVTAGAFGAALLSVSVKF